MSFFGARKPSQCGQDGFVVPSASNKVSNITFDRTVANGNGTAGNNDGYDIQAAVAPAPTPVALPIARFLDAEASSNTQNGIKFTMSAQLENVYVANNTGAGIGFGPVGANPSSVVGEVTLLNSTIKNNGSPQIQAMGNANPNNVLGFNLSVNNTIVTGSGSINMFYSKKYTGSGDPPTGPGGQIRWTRDVVSRADAGPRVRYRDRIGNVRDCTGMQVLALCDAVGDCNFDFAVTADEIIIMVGIGQGEQPLSACYQGDFNGDRTVTIEEITAAISAAQQNDVHDSTRTIVPTFQADGRHLASGSSALNNGLPPTSFTPVPVCRAGCCDADSHPRPSPSPNGAYDIGAYEGPGTQPTSSACLNVPPGQCVSCAGMAAAAASSPPLVMLEAGSVTACSGERVEVPVVMSGSEGVAYGVQFDLLFDPATVSVSNATAACKTAIPGYGGKPYTNLVSKGQLRVMLFDVGGDALADGTVVTCEFETSQDVVGTQPLTLDKYIVAGRAGTILEASAADGQLALSGSCK